MLLSSRALFVNESMRILRLEQDIFLILWKKLNQGRVQVQYRKSLCGGVAVARAVLYYTVDAGAGTGAAVVSIGAPAGAAAVRNIP